MDTHAPRREPPRRRVFGLRHRTPSAHDAYADWRQRKYPRGVRKEKLVQEVADAEVALAEAEAAWQALLEDARRAGVPPGVLRDYE